MTTKRDQILDNLVETLQTITIANGYSDDMRIASKEIKHWEEVGAFPASFAVGNIESLSRGDSNDRIDSLWTVEIHVYVQNSRALSAEIEAMIGDVRTAVFVDKTRDGLALDTTINTVVNMSKWLKPIGVFIMELGILYEYDKGTP